MASEFDLMVAADNAVFLGEFAETISCTPYGQAARNIEAIVLRETRGPRFDEHNRNFYNGMDIQISARDNVEGIVSPKELRNGADFDTFAIDGKTWSLQRVLERDIGGMHKLEVFDGGAA